jgi:outer membrane protein
LVAVLGLILAGGAHAETLADAIALAYDTNPTLLAQRANLRATDEGYVQAQAGFRPTASVQGTLTTDENNEKFGQTFVGDFQTSGAGIILTQPIYTGGRVSSQVTAAQATILAGRETLRSTEQTVLQSVIGAYVDTRRDEQDVAIAQENVGLLERQLTESRARFGVGEITRTDVAETESRVAAARAQLSSTRAQLATSQAEYVAAVGQNPGTLAPEPSMAALLPASLEAAFDTAGANNPQIRQQDYVEQASAAKVAAARALTRPTVSVQASLGYAGGVNGISSPFENYGHAVAATATATVPLFTGGLTSSQVRAAAETDNADRIGIETTRRQVMFQVSQAWNQLLAARASLIAIETEVSAANIAFEGTRQEARVGLRTTLDVLITEQDLSNAQLALVGARHDEYLAGAALLVAMGRLEARDLAPGVALYDPAKNLRRVKSAPGWTPWDPAIAALDRIGAPTVVQRPPPGPVISDPSTPTATAP